MTAQCTVCTFNSSHAPSLEVLNVFKVKIYLKLLGPGQWLEFKG